MTGGGLWELDVPFVVCPLRWFFCLLDSGQSFHFIPCIPPFLGALVYLWLAGLHHLPLEQPKTPYKIRKFPPGKEISPFKFHSSWHQQYQIDKVSNVM